MAAAAPLACVPAMLRRDCTRGHRSVCLPAASGRALLAPPICAPDEGEPAASASGFRSAWAAPTGLLTLVVANSVSLAPRFVAVSSNAASSPGAVPCSGFPPGLTAAPEATTGSAPTFPFSCPSGADSLRKRACSVEVSAVADIVALSAALKFAAAPLLVAPVAVGNGEAINGST